MSRDEVYVGTGESMQVLVHDMDGALRRILRGPADDLTIRSDDVNSYRERALRGVPDDRRADYERQLREMPMPERFPAFTEMRLDPDGQLWLRQFVRPGDEQARWAVFATDGAYLGAVMVPRELRVTQIGRDHILGIHVDEMDVQRVRLHALRKPS